MRVFILANSPGELAGWVRPVVRHMVEKSPGLEVVLLIVPCQYASGKEYEYAHTIPGVNRVMPFKSLLRDAGSLRCSESCVLFLGGDPFYAVIASKLLRSPAIAYTARPRWKRYFAKYLVPDERALELSLKRRVKADKVRVVGQLATDSIEIEHTPEQIRSRLGFRDLADATVTFLPGSRPVEYRLAVPYMLSAAKTLSELINGVQVCIALSPFVDKQVVRELIRESGVVIESEKDGITHVRLPNQAMVAIEWERPHEAMSISDLAVTLPGTNTLQLAVMRVPMIMFIAVQYADQVPVEGLLGLLSERFRVFRALKKHLLLKAAQRGVVLSLPNIITRKNIVPELITILLADELAQHTANMLNDKAARERMTVELGEIAAETGTAAIIAAEAIKLAVTNTGGVCGPKDRCL